MIGTQGAGATVKVQTLPACVCGHAYEAHSCAGWHPIGKEPCLCRGYQGSRAPEYRFLTSSRIRRWLCVSLWWIERRAEAWRLTLEQGA